MNIRLLNLKISKLKKLYNNYIKQLKLLEDNKDIEFSKAVEEQEGIINELKNIDKELKSNNIDNQSLLIEIDNILKDIKKIQNTIINKINKKKKKLSEKFKQINTGKKAIYGGYIKAEPVNNGYFIDKKIGR